MGLVSHNGYGIAVTLREKRFGMAHCRTLAVWHYVWLSRMKAFDKR